MIGQKPCARIARGTLHTDPYRWAAVDKLFVPADADALAAAFPRDHYKHVAGPDGEKDYHYEARALVPMGADAIAHLADLREPWQRLAQDVLSAACRTALSSLTGCDLPTAWLEVNVFHYGPSAVLGPHAGLPEKIVTHVLYFNASWDAAGGVLNVLRAKDAAARQRLAVTSQTRRRQARSIDARVTVCAV